MSDMNSQQLRAAFEKALAGWESNLGKVARLEATVGDLRDEVSRLMGEPSVIEERERLKAAVLTFAQNKMHRIWHVELAALFEEKP